MVLSDGEVEEVTLISCPRPHNIKKVQHARNGVLFYYTNTTLASCHVNRTNLRNKGLTSAKWWTGSWKRGQPRGRSSYRIKAPNLSRPIPDINDIAASKRTLSRPWQRQCAGSTGICRWRSKTKVSNKCEDSSLWFSWSIRVDGGWLTRSGRPLRVSNSKSSHAESAAMSLVFLIEACAFPWGRSRWEYEYLILSYKKGCGTKEDFAQATFIIFQSLANHRISCAYYYQSACVWSAFDVLQGHRCSAEVFRLSKRIYIRERVTCT